MKRPWWITLIVVVAVAAGVAAPLLMSAHADAEPVAAGLAGESGLLIKLFPVYAVAAGLCAWLCWPRRKELTWILLALLALSSAGVAMLTF